MTISRQYDLNPILLSAVEDVNIEQNKILAENVKNHLTEENKISVLGIAFKDKTPVTEASPAINLIQELVIDDVDVTVFDPLAMENARTMFDDEISYANSIEECLASSPVCVVTLMSKDYKNAIENYTPEKNLIVIDCWRQIDASKIAPNVKLFAVGRSDRNQIAFEKRAAGNNNS